MQHPGIITEVLLHNAEVGVWCAVGAVRIIRHIFFSDTTNLWFADISLQKYV
jgi:hypothetical protein